MRKAYPIAMAVRSETKQYGEPWNARHVLAQVRKNSSILLHGAKKMLQLSLKE